METTFSSRLAGAPARSLRWQRGLGIALFVAGLCGAPVLARTASAQRPGTIQASAFVIDSYIGTGLRADSATVTRTAATVRASELPANRQIRIAGFGVLDVRSGSGTEIRVASRIGTMRGDSVPTVTVSITYLGN